LKKLLRVDLGNGKIKRAVISALNKVNNTYKKCFAFGSKIKVIIRKDTRSELCEHGMD
jgi:hypothetical protein